jgi:hypothetical protein
VLAGTGNGIGGGNEGVVVGAEARVAAADAGGSTALVLVSSIGSGAGPEGRRGGCPGAALAQVLVLVFAAPGRSASASAPGRRLPLLAYERVALLASRIPAWALAIP